MILSLSLKVKNKSKKREQKNCIHEKKVHDLSTEVRKIFILYRRDFARVRRLGCVLYILFSAGLQKRYGNNNII